MTSAELSVAFFLQMFFILAACRAVGWVARRCGQPQVIGEMIAGVLIGPSLLGLFWPAALVFCLLWLATAFTTRYSSLSALVASFITPLFLWWFGHLALSALSAVLTLLLFYAHRENIKRLQAGKESRIGETA